MQLVVRVMEGHHQEMKSKQFQNEEIWLNRQTAMQYLLQSYEDNIKKKKEKEVSVKKNIRLLPFCWFICTQSIMLRYSFDITGGFSLVLLLANQIRYILIMTLKEVYIVYPGTQEL